MYVEIRPRLCMGDRHGKFGARGIMRLIAIEDERLALHHLLKELQKADPTGEHKGFLSAYEALDYLEYHAADVAFLDIEMCEMSGLLLAKKIKQTRPSINIIFVTGYCEYALEAHELYVSGYLLKPASVEKIRAALDNLRNPVVSRSSRIRAQCFGNFELFIDDKPAKFRYGKTKELFAYLIDRRGAAVTTGELCAILYEDRPESLSVRSHVRNLLSDLTHTLGAASAAHILVKGRNRYAIDPHAIDCDYYRYINKDVDAINAYYGEYMLQYSWAEMTIGFLETRKE